MPQPHRNTPAARPSAGRSRWLAAALGAGAVAAAPVLPAPAAWALAALAGAALAALWPRPAGPADDDAPMDNEAAPYAQVLQRQVLPVWRRNVEAARGHSDTAMTALLERFASVSAQLDLALSNSRGATLEAGADELLLARHRAELDRLLASTLAAAGQRDAALAAAQAVSGELEELARQAREVQAIGRATHLLALNASAEATRAGSGNGTFAVVAQEVRQLAAQSRQAGTRINQRVQALRQQLADLASRAGRSDMSPEELRLQAEDNARAVVRALVGSLAEVSRSSRTLRDAGRQIQTDIDDILVNLQSQDRLSQMLTSVTDDMHRMESLLAGNEDAGGDTAIKWLERLDASYTMEEMRSSHHDTVSIDRQAAVEFF